MEIAKYNEAKEQFALACKNAEGLSLVQNAGAAFEAVVLVKQLRDLLTDEIMKEVFMPLMNTKIGFATDRDGKARSNNRPALPLYDIDVVRDAIIDASAFGLLPTFNQMNIISGKMYATKEGFTALLKRLKCKHILSFGQDTSKPDAKFAEISVKINFEYQGEKSSLLVMAVVPKNAYSSYDQLKGKAERRGKKVLYEYITGLDLGENDGETIKPTQDREPIQDAVEVQEEPQQQRDPHPMEQGEPEKITLD